MIELRSRADDESPSPAPYGAAPAPQPPAGAEPSWNQPGGLDIKEKRSWRTWHLLTTALVTLLVGMAIGHSGSKTTTGGQAKGLFKLPDASSPPPSTAAPVDTEPPTPTPPTVEAADAPPAAETPATGVAKVLFSKKASGALAPTALNIKGGTWKIGWAYDCTQSGTADGSGPFQIIVTPASGAAATAVDETGRSKTGVTSQTVAGALTFEVRTACRWAVKVTGIPG